MARTVAEWIGKTDDHRAPASVRQRVYDRDGGRCHICSQPVEGKKWALDHVVALINGGENRESNLKPIHIKCHTEKTAADVAEKSKVAAMRQKHTGARRPESRLKGEPKPAKVSTKLDFTKRRNPLTRQVIQ